MWLFCDGVLLWQAVGLANKLQWSGVVGCMCGHHDASATQVVYVHEDGAVPASPVHLLCTFGLRARHQQEAVRLIDVAKCAGRGTK